MVAEFGALPDLCSNLPVHLAEAADHVEALALHFTGEHASVEALGMHGDRVDPKFLAVAGGPHQDLVNGQAGAAPLAVDLLGVSPQLLLELFVALDVGFDLLGRPVLALVAQT